MKHAQSAADGGELVLTGVAMMCENMSKLTAFYRVCGLQGLGIISRICKGGPLPDRVTSRTL